MELNTFIAHTSLIIYSMPFTLIIFVTLHTQGCDHANFLLCNTYCKISHWLRCPCPSFSLYSYKTPEHFTIFKLRFISILYLFHPLCFISLESSPDIVFFSWLSLYFELVKLYCLTLLPSVEAEVEAVAGLKKAIL